MVALSSTILEIPMRMLKLKTKSQNSFLSLASFHELLEPFFVMNLSMSLGVPRAFPRFSFPISEKEITGTRKLRARTIKSRVDPHWLEIWFEPSIRKTSAKYAASTKA